MNIKLGKNTNLELCFTPINLERKCAYFGFNFAVEAGFPHRGIFVNFDLILCRVEFNIFDVRHDNE